MTDWLERARCVSEGSTLNTFFEAIWQEDDDGEVKVVDIDALAWSRTYCDRCPVRRECYRAAMDEEGNAAVDLRAGIRGGMTPAQRWSARHRKAVECPKCHATLDPNAVRQGEITCVNGCAIDREMPPIPEAGDQWTRRHTTLARKVVRWLVEEVDEGDAIPRPSDLAERWKERRTDMCRVFDALVADGTLSFEDRTYHRHKVLGAWSPAHLVLLDVAVA